MAGVKGKSGGPRPGAGRPPKIHSQAPAGLPTPLEYMLAVMRDDQADPLRRDRMAVAAAPYVHAKAGAPVGKKFEVMEAAHKADVGTKWESLLQ